MNGLENIVKKDMIKMERLAKTGKTNKIILNQAIDNFDNIKENPNKPFF